MRSPCSKFAVRLSLRLTITATVALAAMLASSAGASANNFSPIGCKPNPNGHGPRFCPTVNYSPKTLDDNKDNTFNQLLGINMQGKIAGYFGSGLQGHPNKGYMLSPPYSQNKFRDLNFPNSTQTQVTGTNDNGVRVGFWSAMNNAGTNPVNDQHGWYVLNGKFVQADFPTQNPFNPPMDQLLGVNNHNVAVGFWTDADQNAHGYTYDIDNKSFNSVAVPDATSATATAINDNGDIAGFGTFNNVTKAWVRLADNGGQVGTLSFPGADSTQILGFNNSRGAVGVYTMGTALHGFTWSAITGFRTVDAPQGQGTTTLNGTNACGDIVGFYVDPNTGFTHGLLLNANFSKFSSAVIGQAADAFTAKKHKKRIKKIKTKLPKGC